MKKRVWGAMFAALCIPMSFQAADITVMKEIPVAVGEKISNTASPEANRLIRGEMMKARQDHKQVVAPAVKAFTDRLQVTVKPETVKENHLNIAYPTVQSVSPYVTKAINKTITDYVEKLRKQVHKTNEKNLDGEGQNLYMSYDVKADGNGIFSVTITSYTIEDNASNGVNVEKGFTFNTTTGRSLSLSDFGVLPQEKIAALDWLQQCRSWEAKRWAQGLLFDSNADVRIRTAKFIAETDYLPFLNDLEAACKAERNPQTKKQMMIYLKSLQDLLPAK